MLPKVVLALSLILCVFLWSGPFAYAGGWGGGGGGVGHGGGQNTLEYNLFEGDEVGLIELEGIQLTASAANADPGILDRLAVWISSWYSSAKNFNKGTLVAPPELQDQSKINFSVQVVVRAEGKASLIYDVAKVTAEITVVFFRDVKPAVQALIDQYARFVPIEEAVSELYGRPNVMLVFKRWFKVESEEEVKARIRDVLKERKIALDSKI